MGLTALVVTGLIMRARSDQQAAVRAHGLRRFARKQLPSRQRVVEEPVVPARDEKRRRLKRLQQLSVATTRKRIGVLRDLSPEDCRQGFYTGASDAGFAEGVPNELSALCRSQRPVVFPQPAFALGGGERSQTGIALKQHAGERHMQRLVEIAT